MEFPSVTSITDSAKNYIKEKRSYFGVDSNEATHDTSLNMSTVSTDPTLKNRNYAVIITQYLDTGKSAESGPYLQVVGAVPQSFQMSQSVGWAAPWGAGLAGSGTTGDLLAVTGNRLVGQIMTMQVWQGSGGDFEFTLSFELRTWKSPELDVMAPLRDLLRMSLPSMDSTGWLRSPGPVLDEGGVEKIAGQLTQVVTDVAVGAKEALGAAVNGGQQAAKAAVYRTKAKVDASGVVRKSFIEDKLKNKISIRIGTWFELKNVVITQVQHDIKAQTPYGAEGQIQAANVTISFKPMFVLTSQDVTNLLKTPSNTPAAKSQFSQDVDGLMNKAKNLNPFK